MQQRGAGETALGGKANVVSVHLTENDRGDLIQAFGNTEEEIENILKQAVDKHKGIKFYIKIEVKLQKVNAAGVPVDNVASIKNQHPIVYMEGDDLEDLISLAIQQIYSKLDEYVHDGSGWVFIELSSLKIHFVPFTPLAGSTFLKLPAGLTQKQRHLLNVENKQDELCFKYCVLAALFPDTPNPTNPESYTAIDYTGIVSFEGITFPTTLRQQETFIRHNPDVSLNIYGFEEKKVFPLKVSQTTKDKHIDLLLLQDRFGRKHYVLIKNFSGLLYGRTKGHITSHYCRRCLRASNSKELRDKHERDCSDFVVQKVVMPPKGSTIQFEEWDKTYPTNFYIVADFESVLKKVDRANPDPSKSAITTFEVHEPFAWCYQVISTDNKFEYRPPVIKRCADPEECVKSFLQALTKEYDRIKELNAVNVPMELTEEEERQFQTAKDCWICRRPFKTGDKRHRDHEHANGKFR